MKKALALLVAIWMLIGPHALALTGADYPAWDGSTLPQSGFCGSFGGKKLALEFDPAQEYSHCAEGMLQACFFAFDGAERNYLELYLLLPQDVEAGDVLQAGSDAPYSVSLYEVSLDSESLYYAGMLSGAAYPEGSALELRIEAVESGASTLSLRGSLRGKLGRIDADVPTGEFLELEDAYFSCTLPLSAAGLPEATSGPIAPPTGPSFTLPPDYRAV